MTLVAYINHQRGTTSDMLSKIAEKMWSLCLKRNIHLRDQHIPGFQNVIADQASQMKLDRHDWKLHLDIFRIFDQIWESHLLDLFANHHNT